MDIKSALSYFANNAGHKKKLDKATDAGMKEFDSNKDGSIDIAKEARGYTHTDSINIPNYRRLKEAEAKKADTNSDGKISREELKAFFHQMIVKEYDTNGNGDISGWEKSKASLSSSNPEKRLDELASTEKISGEELKQFIDKRIDEMTDAQFGKLLSDFDQNRDAKLDTYFETLSRNSWSNDVYQGRSGDYQIYTRNTYRNELDASFRNQVDTNKDRVINRQEVKDYINKRMDRDGNNTISAEEYEKSKYLNVADQATSSRLVDSETYRVYDPLPEETDDRPRPPSVNDTDDRPRPPSVNDSSDRPRPPAVNNSSDRPRPPAP